MRIPEFICSVNGGSLPESERVPEIFNTSVQSRGKRRINLSNSGFE